MKKSLFLKCVNLEIFMNSENITKIEKENIWIKKYSWFKNKKLKTDAEKTLELESSRSFLKPIPSDLLHTDILKLMGRPKVDR